MRVVCGSVMRHTDNQIHLASEPPVDAAHRVRQENSSHAARRLGIALEALERYVLPHRDRLGWLPCACQAASRAMTARCVVISTHPPIVTHLTALLLKMRFGRPWIADFRDPLWGNPTRTTWRAGLLDPVIEHLVMTAAVAVIANTDASADLLRSRYPALAEKIQLIWNGFDPEDRIGLAPIDGPYIFSHVGSLYGDRCPMALIQSVNRLMADGRLPAWQFR